MTGLDDYTYRTGPPSPTSKVLFTFDDGPDRKVTSELLDVLEKHSLQVTFFVTGENIAGNEDLILRAKNQGHTIGSHGWHHTDMTLLHPLTQLHDLQKTSKVITEICGQPPKFFRPPYGKTSPSLQKAATKLNMETMLWSLQGGDWEDLPPETLSKRLLLEVQPGDIILLHDGRKPYLKTGEVLQHFLQNVPSSVPLR